jgi:hypothetical protein
VRVTKEKKFTKVDENSVGKPKVGSNALYQQMVGVFFEMVICGLRHQHISNNRKSHDAYN